MQDPESYKWIGEDISSKKLSSKEIILYQLFLLITPFLTMLTYFYPFSKIWQGRRFHYNFSEVTSRDEQIIKIANNSLFWFRLIGFERNEKFLIIYGKFVPVSKKAKSDRLFANIHKSFEKEDVYITRLENEEVKFVFVR